MQIKHGSTTIQAPECHYKDRTREVKLYIYETFDVEPGV